jgi:hypothetical protein
MYSCDLLQLFILHVRHDLVLPQSLFSGKESQIVGHSVLILDVLKNTLEFGSPFETALDDLTSIVDPHEALAHFVESCIAYPTNGDETIQSSLKKFKTILETLQVTRLQSFPQALDRKNLTSGSSH